MDYNPPKTYTLAKDTIKYFMCDNCFKVIAGHYNASIIFDYIREVYEDEPLYDPNNIKVYSNIDSTVGIMCPYCKRKGKEYDMFEIDKYMIDPIRYLNSKGYYTQFCCEGHIYSKYIQSEEDAIKNDEMEDSLPYIVFDWDKICVDSFSPETEEDKDFFINKFSNLYTLFKSDYITCKQGLIWPPEDWKAEFRMIYDTKKINDESDHIADNLQLNLHVDSIYYKDKLIDDESQINDPEEKYEHIQKIKKIFSDEEKRETYENKLMSWIYDLPDLHKIHNEKELIEAFKLDEVY